MKLIAFLPALVALVQRVSAGATLTTYGTGSQIALYSDAACTTLLGVAMVSSTQATAFGATTTCTKGTSSLASVYILKAYSGTMTDMAVFTSPVFDGSSADAVVSVFPTSASTCDAAVTAADLQGVLVPVKYATCATLPFTITTAKSIKYASATGTVAVYSSTDCSGTALGTSAGITVGAAGAAPVPAVGSSSCTSISGNNGLVIYAQKPLQIGTVTQVGYYSDAACNTLVNYWLVSTAQNAASGFNAAAATTTCSTAAPYVKLPASSSVAEAALFTTTQFDASSSYSGYANIQFFTDTACATPNTAKQAPFVQGVVVPFLTGSCASFSNANTLMTGSIKYTTAAGLAFYPTTDCSGTANANFGTAALLLGNPQACIALGAAWMTNVQSVVVDIYATKAAASVSITSKSGAYSNISPYMAGSAILMAAAMV
ncbi:hypothetical protein HDU99_004366, partial [Rhizoclosmatium hyalinum]